MAVAQRRSSLLELRPSLAEVERRSQDLTAVPVQAELDPGVDAQGLLDGIAASPDQPFVLESAGQLEPETARWCFAGCSPYAVVRGRDGAAQVERGGKRTRHADPIETLAALVGERPAERAEGDPPFAGGAVGYLSYDLGRTFEWLPHTAVDDLGADDLCFGLYEAALVMDRHRRRARLVATPPPGLGARETHERAREAMEELLRAARAGQSQTTRAAVGPLEPDWSEGDYRAAVERVIEYIRAGDIFQANLSQRLGAPMTGSGAALYRALRQTSPAAFGAYLSCPGIELISSSPERFLRCDGSWIETRPIKGTTRRGSDPTEDEALERALRASEKDRAEHTMIVDVHRNDLGRICAYGTIRVRDLMRVERTASVMHMVSIIEGRLHPPKTLREILRATFPGGSISGAPKVRAMEIIEELEPRRRGPYTGALGYLGFGGDLDLGILIRTMVRAGDRLHLQVGGGIVADSDPGREYQETLLKAEGMMGALQELGAA